ncbi:two-component regulator propeller domain-containing protein [Flavobacterium ovatum]|uniref:hybrid sensor histidine kinase/response regulator transcription factor n=1 Tax=Flavobacterium ovatum TaxID=1928857 RepID=UPI00344FAD96
MPQANKHTTNISRFSTFIIFFFLFTYVCNAQKKNAFIHLTTENGLSQSDVNTIFQDSQGYMWFGTHDGLNKYDGYNFTVFNPILNNNKSISSNLVWKIVDDIKGNLWIGTTGGGLNCFDKKTETFTQFKNKVGDFNSLSNNTINSLFRDKKNRLWISTKNGINMLDLNKPIKKAIFNHIGVNLSKMSVTNSNRGFQSFFEDSNGDIWLGSNLGLLKLSRDNQGELFFQLVNLGGELENTLVRSLVEDDFGRLILSTSKGMYIFTKNGDNKKLVKIHNENFNILLSTKGYLWGSSNNGLYRFENSSDLTVPKEINYYINDLKNPDFSLSKNDVRSLFIDRAGMLWVGVNGGGVNKFDPNIKKFKHVKKDLNPKSINNDKVRALFEDSNGYLWVGTEGGGLNYSPKGDNTYTSFEKLNSSMPKIFSFAEVQEGATKKLLIGGEFQHGLYELDITNPKTISSSKLKYIDGVNLSVFSLLVDSNKNIWIGTYGTGIHRWLATKTPGVYKKDILYENVNNLKSVPSNIIRSIYEDKKGTIWFGTGDGLCKLPKDQINAISPKFEVYKNIPNDDSSISQNYILSLYESSKGDLWVGTFGGGLSKLIAGKGNNKSAFKNYTEKNGLPSNVIKGIQEDDFGNIWISTNKGLSRFNTKIEKFKNYDVNDGLQSNEFSELAFCKRANGEMLFGGVNGFNAFFPADIEDNLIPPKTVLTSLSIFNKPINIGDDFNGRIILPESISTIKDLELKYSENSFSVEFAALHYSAPRKNQFAYKLEGFNDNWIYTTYKNRLATYTNLAPGTYTLLVKSSNNDGIWNETPTELSITIVPPFWRSDLAYVFYLLFFVGCLMAFRRFTIIRTTKKHHLELELFEKEKHDEMHLLKLEFFTNISHEFRTPLTLIKGPLEYLQKSDNSISPSKRNEQYTIMHKNIDYLMRLVNQLLDFRKMDKGKMDLILWKSNVYEFVKLVGEPFQFLSHKKNIDFKISSKLEAPIIWFDTDALEKIMNNLLSNAFKFTAEGGKIQVEVYSGEANELVPNMEIVGNPSDYIVIKVKDSGVGIPSHRLKVIFERFYVDKDFRKVNGEGTGIGLDFTKKLIELHQGYIDVANNKKKGTSFFIWLPKKKEAYINVQGISFGDNDSENNVFNNEINAETHAVEVLDEIVDLNEHKSRSKLPVLLVVEDNPDIRTLIKNGLDKSYDIYEAENGQRGFELANKLMPNIILTDIFMPIMDGMEMCEKLKTTSETSHIPVVMLTAKTSQEWEKEGLKNGADGYVRKPFDMEILELKLKNILKFREDLRRRFNRDTTLQPHEVTVTSADERFLQKAIEVVEKHMMNTEFSVELMVKEMALSRSNLYLKIKELTGLSSSEFIRNIRLKRAMQLLEQSDLSVKEIMYMTGFNTASYFSKCFKKQFGVIPSKYLRETEVEEEKDDEADEN